MHKIKSHKGLRKRVRISASGKVRRQASFAGHLMSKKTGKRRQMLRKKVALVGAYERAAKRALGVG